MPTTMQTAAYKKLVRLTKRLGGQVVVTKEEWKERPHRGIFSDFPASLGQKGWSIAPFCSNIGVFWERKLIVHRPVDFTNAGLIHEMAHVFACRYQPNHNKCEETDFLGWEVTLAKKMEIYPQWMREMKAYGLHDEDDNFTEIGMLDRGERQRIFKRHVEVAQEIGSLGPNLEIRSVRN